MFAAGESDLAPVTPITTDEYQVENPDAAKRPISNVLQLDKVKLLGFTPKNWEEELKHYIKGDSHGK